MKRIATILSIICLAAFLATETAYTADRYWDTLAGAANGVGGSATWTLQTDALWSTTSAGDAALTSAATTDDGIFAGTAGTVTIAGDLTLVSWTFNTTNYVLTPSSATLRTLTGSFSLAASVNLNIGSAAATTDRTFSLIGSGVTGGAGSGLTLQGAQTTADGRAVRIQLSQAGASIDVPITISGTGTTAAGIIANATGTGVTGTITNNSGFTTLLGATSGNDLTLSSAAVISGTAGLRIGLNGTTSDNVGPVTLNAANLYSGGTTLDGGTLVLGNDSALGTGTLTLSNSSTSVLQNGGADRTLANNIVWGGNGTISGSNAFKFNGTFTSSGAISRTLTVSNTGGTTLDGNVFLAGSDVAGGLTINGTSSVTISGVITNNAAANTFASALTKNGSNTLELTAANTYTGTTTVNAGALLVNTGSGSGTGTGAVNVTAGTLGGFGSVSGAVTVGNAVGVGDSFISPGGTFTTTSTLSIANDGVYVMELNSDGSTADQIVAAGVTLNSSSSISMTDLGATTLALATAFTIIDNTSSGAISGTFANLTDGQIVAIGPNSYQASYSGGIGANDLTLTVVVPEPSTWAMIGVGSALLMAVQRLHRKTS